MLLSFVIIGLMGCRAKENVEPQYQFIFVCFGKRPVYLTASPGMSQLGWNWMEWPHDFADNFRGKQLLKKDRL